MATVVSSSCSPPTWNDDAFVHGHTSYRRVTNLAEGDLAGLTELPKVEDARAGQASVSCVGCQWSKSVAVESPDRIGDIAKIAKLSKWR